MKTWHLWVGLALLVLLLLTVREGFAATATIKNPNTWDAAELTRIKAMVTPASTLPDADIRRVVGGFWQIWDGATERITTAQVSSYLDGVQNLGANRGIFQTLIQKYYIDQGQSVFTAASGYSTTVPDATVPRPPSEAGETTKTIERPTSATDSLRREIATTFGVTLTDATSIDKIVTLVQSFYDTVYVANNKAAPTYTQMMSFADGVDVATLPAGVKNNFKPHMVEVLQTFFTPAGGAVVTPEPGTGATAGAADFSSSAGGAEGGQTFGSGKNVQGPSSGGLGTNENSTGGLGIPRNYPVLYGGQQSYESAIPTSASLGTDPTSRFLPYSRVPGDMDLYPDPYRLGKYFSTSSYSSGKDAPEPAPFLADFSKFFT
jgi:hypothetical protein